MPEAESIQAAWDLDLDVFYCAHCHSAHLALRGRVPSACPACLSPDLGAEAAGLRREPPELLLPFEVDDRRAQAMLDEWAAGIRFRPDELHPDILLSRMHPYYFPLWLVDSTVEGTWQAEVGFDYQAMSYREQYQGGEWVSEQVTETRVRWEPRVGRLKRHYENVAVAAMEQHQEWMTRLGGYNLSPRRPYAAAALNEAVVRVPDTSPEAAWPDAERILQETAAADCRRASEADHIRSWSMNARYSDQNWTQMLLPAYVTYYRAGEYAFPVWINGQNGRIYGQQYRSQPRANKTSLLMAGIAILLFLCGVLLATIGAALIVPTAIGSVLVVLALALGAAAPAPAIWVWLQNRRITAQQG